MLEITHLTSGYNAVPAIENVNITVDKGEFVSIVGPNGAGKTTLFKTISGTVGAMSGSIAFEGQDLLATPPWKRAHLRISHVPEGRQIFATMTVFENIEIGANTEAGRSNWSKNQELIHEWFPDLMGKDKQLAGTLSGGEQQMLAIARSLASSPTLLLLDEPSMGLAPAIADTVFERLVGIQREASLTILLVEQRVAESLDVADRGYVLESGKIILEGTNEKLKANDRIRSAYLGM